MHSTPLWPPVLSDDYSYDNDLYAQHFICVTIDKQQLELLGKVLFVSRPQVYENTFDTAFLTSTAPTLLKALQGKYETKATKSFGVLKTKAGQNFDFFYKNKAAKIDIWADLIATTKKSNMYVETWLRDSAAVPDC